MLAFLALAVAPLPTLAITHVTVIDGTDGRPLRNATVLLEGDRIKAVGRVRIPEGTREIDGKGKFLIPGLWDMHVHATGMNPFSALYVANGVTGVRDMFTSMPQVKAERIANARLDHPGPTIVAAGRILDGNPPIWAGSLLAMNPEDGRKAVDTAIAEGSDFIKVYNRLPKDAYLAIVDEARKRKIPFAGHVPDAVTAQVVAEAGQRSVEHVSGFLRSVADPAKLEGLRGAERTRMMLATYDARKARDLARLYARRRVWQCPTLTVLRSIMTSDPAIAQNPNVKYLPPFVKAFWTPRTEKTPEQIAADRAQYAKIREVVALFRRERVPILAGTDVMNPYCLPGFSLHDELELLVSVGYSPKEALQAATRNPARFLNGEREFGTIRPGLRADLVLLDADPLASIGNTRRIRTVFLRGRELDRAALDGILTAAERAGKGTSGSASGGFAHDHE